MEFYVASDLYQAGRTEDGEPFIAEVYYVFAEDTRGNRWVHRTSFPGCRVEVDEEEGFQHFADVREKAEAAANFLLSRIQDAGGQIDFRYWLETRPAYGSAAYTEYGQADEVAWEREQG